ncbi:MAG: hypothetical protein JW795_18420 [Chitinivibrionales bacterium]|nr:hypothetical protein [Chitinivibrionales bacterium]
MKNTRRLCRCIISFKNTQKIPLVPLFLWFFLQSCLFADTIPGIPIPPPSTKVLPNDGLVQCSWSILKYFDMNNPITMEDVFNAVNKMPLDSVPKALEKLSKTVPLFIQLKKALLPWSEMKKTLDIKHPFIIITKHKGTNQNIFSIINGYIVDSTKIRLILLRNETNLIVWHSFADLENSSGDLTYAGVILFQDDQKTLQKSIAAKKTPPDFQILSPAPGTIIIQFNSSVQGRGKILHLYTVAGSCIYFTKEPCQLDRIQLPVSLPHGFYFLTVATLPHATGLHSFEKKGFIVAQ